MIGRRAKWTGEMWRKTFENKKKSCFCHLLNTDCRAHMQLFLLVIRFLLRKSTTIDHITHSMRLIWKHVSKHTLARKFNFIQCTIAPYCLKSFWCHYHFHVWCNTSISCNIIITHMYVLMATNFPLSTTIATN